jgi:hypothetical protein
LSMAERTDWQRALESELRAMARQLDVPPADDRSAAVRQRLEVQRARRPHVRAPGPGTFVRGPGWRAALVVVLAALAVLLATPQGRAVISHVLRLAGVEIRQGPGPAPSPRITAASLPGARRMSLEQARHRVSFPILVPAALGRPAEVEVSGGGRVASLIYHRTRYGTVLVDEFAGRVDSIVFEKFVHFSDVTKVEVNGREGLWIKGPQMLMYVNRAGFAATASARLTTGNTLIWGTGQVALRLEGNLGKKAALVIASSAR